jgi:DNA polymerase-3 subunit gamma/tau
VGLEGNTLTVGFNNPGARESFANGRGDLILQQALIDLVGQDWRIDAIVDPAAQPGTEPTHTVVRSSVPPSAPPAGAEPGDPASSTPTPPSADAQTSDAPPAWAVAPESEPAGAGPSAEPVSARARAVAAVAAEPSTRSDGKAGAVLDDHAHRDDPDLDDVLDGAELLSQRLGAQVIEEIPHD